MAEFGTGFLGQEVSRVVGAATAKKLGKLGVATVEDLLRYYPRRYDKPGKMTTLRELGVGEHVTVMARVASAEVRTMRARRGAILSVTISDGLDALDLTFFAKHPGVLQGHQRKLGVAETGLFTGTVSLYRGKRQLTHPDYLMFKDFESEEQAIEKSKLPMPIYPAGQGIATWHIAAAVGVVLDQIGTEDWPDALPEEYRRDHGLIGGREALESIHRPQDLGQVKRAEERLRHEEAFVLQTVLAQRRAVLLSEPAVARAARPGGIRDAFDARLPFELTAGQREVGETLEREIGDSLPMLRLLQGEVGSGKTVVALRAMLQVIDAGGQAALLAPTEVLAQQHHRSITALLGPLAEGGMLGGAENGTRVVLLTGSMKAAERKKSLLAAASGEAGIVVGTHALLSEGVQIPHLGLVVVDEQHRFGVEQRDALRSKANVTPHALVMTATPIPRTVAMTSFGDLEVSTLRELPSGRAGVATTVVPSSNIRWVQRAWERMRQEIDGGGRVYVVCPRITSSESSASVRAGAASDAGEDALPLELSEREGEAQGPGDGPPMAAVEDVVEMLRASPALQGVEVAVMHGRLPAEEKDAAMASFASGVTPVLVSTTVIEVGVDVPEATMMVILDAERFGLSQLHQLRGRIGRGDKPGLCLAMTSALEGSSALQRVQVFATTSDGFALAEQDLQLRHEGDVLGASQSGRASSLRLLRVLTDGRIIEDARVAARALIARNPALAGEPGLASAVESVIGQETAEYLQRA
ncbi:ATP-dependent DNA helicase RecG [Bogoriella caseilytica]|uniref:Probable DNA 3'-5' helicase RecG n=1 Tax=Bogoriella caseilytica TaxID=56055 RepID=A0A3N2B9J2_9MICO|nr:ATP-dependent DNA helicase RecG [Bogoriella caseilytica]ROR71921.1 ATP-dependent DNA helicase RecG [Bogoriella caseilytica]